MSPHHHPRLPDPLLEGLFMGLGITVVPALTAVIAIALLGGPEPPPRPAVSVQHVEALPIPNPERLADWETSLALDRCAECWATCCPFGGTP